MPISKELRPLYRTPAYRAAHAAVMERAGRCCENCGKPHMTRVETMTGRSIHGPVMIWRFLAGGWRDQDGAPVDGWNRAWSPARRRAITVKIGPAHLNHTPGDDRVTNLRALCQWCHLHYDYAQHAQTRGARKDAARPIQWTGAIAL